MTVDLSKLSDAGLELLAQVSERLPWLFAGVLDETRARGAGLRADSVVAPVLTSVEEAATQNVELDCAMQRTMVLCIRAIERGKPPREQEGVFMEVGAFLTKLSEDLSGALLAKRC